MYTKLAVLRSDMHAEQTGGNARVVRVIALDRQTPVR